MSRVPRAPFPHSRRVDAPLAQLRTATLRGFTVYPSASQRDVFYVADPSAPFCPDCKQGLSPRAAVAKAKAGQGSVETLPARNYPLVFVMRADPKPISGVSLDIGQRAVTRIANPNRPDLADFLEVQRR